MDATADLAARIAVLAALIEARLAEDEARAAAMEHDVNAESDYFSCPGSRTEPLGDLEWGEEHCWCGIAGRKGRKLRRVKATRELVAAVLAEEHDYVPGDEFYSCSQAADPYPGESGEPGSGCSDPERAGKPCDCGRDARVARLLEIIASEWEDAS